MSLGTSTPAAAPSSFDLQAVRRRFSALASGDAFLDAPAGTQVPDEVVRAIADYLERDNANVGGYFERSARTDALIDSARECASRFFNCRAEEVGFGPNMTTLNFQLSRAATRDLEAGDEIIMTRLDHDANVAPWLEAARDRGLVVRTLDVRDDTTLDLDQLQSLLTNRTRIVAFTWASNAVGTVTDAKRAVELAHRVGALAWIDATHYAAHRRLDVTSVGADIVLCSAYKFFGPHVGLFYGRKAVLERWRPYKVRPAATEPIGHRFETGTLAHENLAGVVAAIRYIESVGWDAITAHERALGERFLAGLPRGYRLLGLPSMEGRVPTFAVALPGTSPDDIARELGRRGIAVWSGNYYAVEIMERFGLPDGAVRIGFVHYSSFDEVDRVLVALEDIAAARRGSGA